MPNPIFKKQTIDSGDASACEFLLAALSLMDYVEQLTQEQTHDGGNSNFQLAERLKFQSNAQLKKMLSFTSETEELSLVHSLLDLLSHPTDSSLHNNTNNNNSNNANGNAAGHHHSHSTSLYAKTSAIQILSKLTSSNATLVHSQILSAPDGLHRIVDLLKPSSIEEECIRNEVLILCTVMAQTNAGSARLMIFGEAYDKVMDIATEDDDMNMESKVKKDCLKLMIEMTKQDEMGVEVFLGSGRLVRCLARLLDLRVGDNFVNPSEELHDEDDDLDDIMNLPSSDGGEGHGRGRETRRTNMDHKKIPYLTENEADVTLFALELFRVLVVGDHDSFSPMTNVQSRQHAIMAHDVLTRLLIDMALYTLPPPDSPVSMYVCAVPPLQVQLRALDVLAALAFGSSEEMQQSILSKQGIYLNAGVLDRIMYLICTGDGANRGCSDTSGDDGGGADEISMHCLGVLRCLLSAKEASTMMMYTLAPPPPEDDDAVTMPPEAPEVQKLVNTLGENLHVLLNDEIRRELAEDDKKRISRMIIGSAGALGIFLTNGAGDTTREILLRVPMPPPPPSSDSGKEQEYGKDPSLVDVMIRFVEFCSNDKDSLLEMKNVVAAVLRLFLEWVPSTPSVISALLSSASSVSLGVLLQQKQDKSVAPTISALSGVILGLCMNSMKSGDDIGGWSISTIMNLINVGLGIGKFTLLLESLKTYMIESDDKHGVEPWNSCRVERMHLLRWYTSNVGVVRKRAIQEFTLSNGNNSDSDCEDESKSNAPSTKESKATKKLVSQQTTEIEELKCKLAEAEESISANSLEVKHLRKRMESNPSQLDDLLNECTTKISSLEIQNLALSSKLTVNESDFKESNRQNDAASVLLKEEVDKARNETRVVLEDKINLQEELLGLTSAYTNLEGEYNRVAAPGSSHTNEEVMPMSSYQIIQDENTKLKKNVRVSNNWMKKAQQKINDLVKRTAELQSENNSCVSQIAKEAETAQASHDVTLKQLHSVSTDRDRLISEVESLNERIVSAEVCQGQGIEAKEKISSLTLELLNMRNDTEAECNQYTASVAGLEQSLVSKNLIIFDLETRIQEAEETLVDAKLTIQQEDVEKMQNLQEEVNKLNATNKAAQKWMADAHQRHTSMKQQILKLKEENNILAKEEQERLSASAQHVQVIEEQMQEVSINRDAANRQLEELETKLIDIETSKETQLTDMSKEIEELKYQMEKEDGELNENLKDEELHNIIDMKNEATKAIAELQMELDVLKKELADAHSSELTSKSEYEEQNSVISRMTVEIQIIKDENNNLSSQREGHVAAIEDMKNRLTEFNSWSETAQQRIGELESEKELSDDRINVMEQEINVSTQRSSVAAELNATQKSNLDAAILRSNKLEADMADASNNIQGLKHEICVLKNIDEQTQSNVPKDSPRERLSIDQLQKAESLNKSAEFEHNEHDAELLVNRPKEEFHVNQEVQFNQLRSEVLKARVQISDLEKQNIHSDAKIHSLEEVERKLNVRFNEVGNELEQSKNDLDATQKIMSSNERELNDLKSEMTGAQRTLVQLEMEKQSLIQELRFKEQEREETAESRKLDVAEVDVLRSEISDFQSQINDLTQRNSDLQCKADLLDEVEENMFEKENDVSQLRDALVKAKEAFDNLQIESGSAIALWKGSSSYSSLVKRLHRWELTLFFLLDRVDDLESEIGKLESQVIEQEEEAKEAIVLWEQQEEEAKEAIVLWKQHCASLESEMEVSQTNEEIEDLKVQVSTLKEDVCVKQAMLEETTANLSIEQENVGILTTENSDAEQIYKDHIEELELAMQDHITTNRELLNELQNKEDTLANTQSQIEVMTSEIEEIRIQSEEVVTQWQDNSKDLEEAIVELESTIEKQNSQATIAIEQWEARCNALSEQIQKVENDMADDDLYQRVKELNADLEDKVVALQECTEERDCLIEKNDSHIVFEKELSITINELKSDEAELSSTLLAKENSSLLLQVERDNAINSLELKASKLDSELTANKQLQASFCELQALHETTKVEMKKMREGRETLQRNYETQKKVLEEKITAKKELEEAFCELQALHDTTKVEMKKIHGERETLQRNYEIEKKELEERFAAKKELEASFCELQAILDATNVEMEEIRGGREALQRNYEIEKKEFNEKISSEEDEKYRFRDAMHISEDENNELKSIIGQLEVELNEANDALQSQFTDEVTIRATERAASALRAQIKEMRDKHMFDHQAIAHEKEIRLNVEAQVQELKRDIVLLAQGTEQMDGEERQVQFMTSKAAAEIMHREREEIESLQKSLEHVIAELKASKLKERNNEDQAANSRVHASMCEQELLSTKSNVDQLKQWLDEAKCCESEMQKLLEKRVKSLEEDRQSILNTNRADYEALKAEFSNTIIERDQLIHALNESEKANSTLVYSTTVEIEKENVPSPDLELSRLRMENAQLLCLTAKSAARTERRVKSALAGDLAAVEQEINSKQQQYDEAKQNLEATETKLVAISEELERMKAKNQNLVAKLKSVEGTNVAEDLKRLEADFSRLQVEKFTLETSLGESISTSKSNVSKLEEKCKIAEMKIRRLESAEHKEAALAAEIAKIQDENRALNNAKLKDTESFDDMASNTEAKCENIDPTDQLDLIRDLQSEMNSEREIYQELLEEHEDLLALLAQQDCEKKCLQLALAEADGNDAVERAILQAEEKVVQQFGKYVQIK